MKTALLYALSLAALASYAPAQAPAGPLTLNQAIQGVLARYPSIAAAQDAVDAASARAVEANASRLPQVSAQGGYSYNSLRPYVAIAIPGLPAGSIYENVTNSYATTVTARQLLTDFGRTDKLVDMARSGRIAAQDALEGVRHQLGYQMIGSFYGTLLLRRSADVAREEIDALNEALRISQRKFAAGSATRFDVLTTQVRLANAQNHLTDTLSQGEKEENGLRQLLGLSPSDPVNIRGELDASAAAIEESAAIADGLANRPEMRVAQDDAATAKLRLDAANRGDRPRLDAQVTGGVENGVMPSLYDNKGFVMAGLSLEVPLFTGRRTQGARLEAGAGVRTAEARERELAQSITTEVADAYSDLRAARARLSNSDTLVDQANEALALAKTRYTNGVITNFELLDAQSAFRAAELGRLQARYDCILARQAVARAAGVAPQQ
ncbi:MAG TPA: TolC family protein [Opitutaceae bacterium]|jgi:outer membrane protein TolC